jgi:hypothetical protein
MLRKAERDFVNISKLKQRSWADSSDWSHPYLFETDDLHSDQGYQWENPKRGSSFSLKDNNILFQAKNGPLIDEIGKNCLAKQSSPRIVDWDSHLD